MKCKNCGLVLLGNMERCPKCGYNNTTNTFDDNFLKQKKLREEEECLKQKQIQEEEYLRQKQREEEAARRDTFAEEKKTFLSTTGYNFEGYTIKKYLGIKDGSIVLGTGFCQNFLSQ